MISKNQQSTLLLRSPKSGSTPFSTHLIESGSDKLLMVLEGETTRDNWVPIFPVTIAWNVQRTGVNETNETYSRTMLHLKLSYAWTIWKEQGQTISKPILIDLEKTEMEL